LVRRGFIGKKVAVGAQPVHIELEHPDDAKGELFFRLEARYAVRAAR
jgi:hypothetical protein